MHKTNELVSILTFEAEVTNVTIGDLKPYQNRFRVSFKVLEKGETREVNSKDNPDESHRISDIKVADDTSSIIFSAWDDDIDLLEEGKAFELTNGYVNVFRGSMRLTRGKFGAIAGSSAEISPNLDKNRSDEQHEARQRRGPSSYGDRRQGGYQSGGNYRSKSYNRGSNFERY